MSGVNTHQLLLAILGSGQQGGSRGDILAELRAAFRHRDSYRDSFEELTPLRGDPPAVGIIAVVAAAVLIRPAAWRWFAHGSVSAYALTPEAWSEIADGRGGSPPICRTSAHLAE